MKTQITPDFAGVTVEMTTNIYDESDDARIAIHLSEIPAIVAYLQMVLRNYAQKQEEVIP